MAAHSRLYVYNTMLDTGLIPTFYQPDAGLARQIIAACAAGGARVIEFTNRGDFAFQAFTGLAQHFAQTNPDLILGVGSIVDAPTAALYIASGASFVVGPVLNPEVARLCNRRKIAYIPGCGTVSEMSQAEELGAEIVKPFPAQTMGGPAFVQSILGPCPWMRLMPTRGVDPTEESINAWFKAGIACAGMGSTLITPELVAAGEFDALAGNVRQVLAWIKATRGE
ncbi:MAG: bifunctional 4-hydroxy-2-oxoglutarate aldolase/2-dehydro-3-deoxy-phosphogluconate aldolase [Anaerolineae bacterium]|jgi:2-dehydro-3-deoxyphosphogluconate aldolase/(4S)-4-hydroxy-2-oxoglutarate aldolase|nr:bifunctional 4-hydroxy-2-oxoglutarate aldolase/2-dehydro-3-deoxy-phosphogluconate aldolase [Anaerolineae bacterium]